MTSDYSELVEYQKKYEEFANSNLRDFFTWATREIAGRFLNRVTKLTPRGDNEDIKYKFHGTVLVEPRSGGNLVRGWTGGTSYGNNPEIYAQTVPVLQSGNSYELSISNNVEYAAYVEEGHKQEVGKFVPYIGDEDANGVRQGARLVRAKVPGVHMMSTAVVEIAEMSEGLGQKLIRQYLDEHF